MQRHFDRDAFGNVNESTMMNECRVESSETIGYVVGMTRQMGARDFGIPRVSQGLGKVKRDYFFRQSC